jgi:hypothetical protein
MNKKNERKNERKGRKIEELCNTLNQPGHILLKFIFLNVRDNRKKKIWFCTSFYLCV